MEPTQPNQPDPPSPRERDLINAAIDAAQPRSDTPDDPSGLPPPGTFEGYDLLREIHRGGQGVVYLAIQRATKRRVAIKVLHGGPFGSATMRSRFEREVQILGQLDHPNIVGIHDSGHTADGSFYYVMDYISGKPLDEMVSGEPRPPIAQTLKLFLKICDAVNAAHLRGVIHRDLKPSNVRVRPDGEPVVVDFGLAKTAGNEIVEGETPQLMSVTGQFIGSLPWASPEQAEGVPSKIDTRTDVYSLGVILYQLLTGKFPYPVIGQMREVLENILRAEPAKPSTVRRQINDEVETIVLKCLAKERERRYQTAGELARDIRHYMDGEPIEAKRDSGWYVISKTLKRYRAQAVFGAATLAMIVVFGIVMSVLFSRALAAEHKAKAALERERAALGQAEQARQAESAQRQRAESSRAAGHSLAMRLLRGVHGEIRALRGATKARDMLLTLVLEYLAWLRTEAGDDAALLRDVADGYEVVADMLGGLSERVLANTKKAAEYYDDARAIREGVLARLPNDPRSHADIARSLRNLAGVQVSAQDYAQAVALTRESIASLDRALALVPPGAPGPAESQTRALEDDRARALWSLAHSLRRLADADPDSPHAPDRAREADENFSRAESHWLARHRADPNNVEAHRDWLNRRGERIGLESDLIFERWRKAEALRARGDQVGAISAFDAAIADYTRLLPAATQALSESEALAAGHPDHRPARRDVFVHAQRLADIHEYTAKAHEQVTDMGTDRAQAAETSRRSSLAAYSRVLEVARALAAEDAANREAARDVAIGLSGVARQQVYLGMYAEATANVEDSLALRTSLYESDPIPRNETGVAKNRYFAGEVAKERADAAADPAVRREFYTKALEHFAECARLSRRRIAAGGDGAADLEAAERRSEEVRQSLTELPPDPP